MTLANLYQNVDAKGATTQIRIAGNLITERHSVSWDFAIEQVPTATIRLPNPPPAVAQFDATVRIEQGFNNLTTRVFTGTVLNVNPDEEGCRIECQGKSKVLENAFHKIVVTIDGVKTAQQLITELLDDAGVTDYVVNMPAWTPGTVCPHELEFATYGEAITKIAEVDGGRWYELPTGTIRVEPRDPIPSLNVWRTYFSMQLTALVASYPTGITSGSPRLRRIAVAQQTRDVKNRCYVRGCTYTQTEADGTENSIDVEGDAQAPSPWVLNPDGSQAYSDELFANELIDTPAKAGEVAARIVTLLNRLTEELSPEIDGDPQMFLAGTVGVEDPGYTGVSGRWFVEGYSTRIDESDFVTTPHLLGGAEVGGTVNICPFALFTYRVDREIMGDTLWGIVTFDACASVDPDGTIESYAWEDNQSPSQITGSSAQCLYTVRVDPTAIVDPWEVTLTVTDDDGCADDITLVVTLDLGAYAVTVPALFLAFDAWFSASPDGGVTWNDQPCSGTSAISVGAKPGDGVNYGIAVFGTSAGSLYRTTDYCATAPALAMAAVASPIVHVWWDTNHPTECWALTEDGRLYCSMDNGATWGLYKDLNTLPWLVPADGEYVRGSRIATPAPNGVWVFGGQYIDWSNVGCLVGWPLIAWDANLNNNWTQAAVGGELLEDLIAYGGPPGCTGVAGGPLDLYVREAASREAEELAIIFNSDTWMTGVYFTPAVFDDGSAWTRALAQPDKTRGRWIAPNYPWGEFAMAWDDQFNYRGEVDPATMRMTLSLAPATLDVHATGIDAPNHGIWMGASLYGLSDVYLVCAEEYPATGVDGTAYKTWDDFDTVDKLRPAVGFPAAPAGANAKMIAIGTSAELVGDRLAAMGRDVSPREVSSLNDFSGTWTSPVAVAGITELHPRVIPITDQLWFALNEEMDVSAWGWGTGARSLDGGATWGATPDPGVGGGGIMDIARDAGGRLWCLVHDGDSTWTRTKVFWSDDDGDTWTLSITRGDATADMYRTWRIVPHPSNQNVIAVVGHYYRGVTVSGVLFYTGDRGSSWTVTLRAALALGDYALLHRSAVDMVMLPNGRMVICGNFGGGTPYKWRVRYSDDEGATWTTVFSVDNSKTRLSGLFTNPGGDRLAFFYEVDNTASPRDHRLMLSIDGGGSFSQASLAVEAQDFVGADFDVVRFAMSPERDTIYLATDAAKDIVRLSPVSAAGVWTDLTDAYPHANQGERNLAAVPRAP